MNLRRRIRRGKHRLRKIFYLPPIRWAILFFFGSPRRQFISVISAFGVAPLVSNSYFAIEAYFIEPIAFGKTVHDCNVTAVTAGTGILVNLIAFAFLRLGPKKTLMFTFLQSLAVIIAFAGIYEGHGLSPGVNQPAEQPLSDEWTSLYFSIVTWTTLGYGDYVAPAEIRLVAALEAILGYFTFGMLVGLLTSVASEQRAQIAATLHRTTG